MRENIQKQHASALSRIEQFKNADGTWKSTEAKLAAAREIEKVDAAYDAAIMREAGDEASAERAEERAYQQEMRMAERTPSEAAIKETINFLMSQDTEEGVTYGKDKGPGWFDKKPTREQAIDYIRKQNVDAVNARYGRGEALTTTDTVKPAEEGGVGSSASNPAKPTNKAEYDKLPSGTWVVGSDGKTRQKP